MKGVKTVREIPQDSVIDKDFWMRFPKHMKQSKHMQTGECKTEKSFGTGKNTRSQEIMTGWEKIFEIICLIKGEQSK